MDYKLTCLDKWMDTWARVDGLIKGWMDTWRGMHGQMDGWIDTWIDGWIDGLLSWDGRWSELKKTIGILNPLFRRRRKK